MLQEHLQSNGEQEKNCQIKKTELSIICVYDILKINQLEGTEGEGGHYETKLGKMFK